MLFSGVIFDGEELHYLERSSTDEGGGGNDDEGGGNGIAALHFLYRHADMKINQTCGEEATFKYFIFILSVSSFLIVIWVTADSVIFSVCSHNSPLCTKVPY